MLVHEIKIFNIANFVTHFITYRNENKVTQRAGKSDGKTELNTKLKKMNRNNLISLLICSNENSFCINISIFLYIIILRSSLSLYSANENDVFNFCEFLHLHMQIQYTEYSDVSLLLIHVPFSYDSFFFCFNKKKIAHCLF